MVSLDYVWHCTWDVIYCVSDNTGVLWWHWISSVWGFCGWYPQMDVVGERIMEADRRLSNGLSVISCWVSGPGSTLWVWASGAGTPQDMERSPSAAWWVCAVWHCSSETQKPNVQVSCYWLWQASAEHTQVPKRGLPSSLHAEVLSLTLSYANA